VRIQPTVDPMTRTIEIVADVDNKDNLLRPGMYVEVELTPPKAPAADTKSVAADTKSEAKAAPAGAKGPLAARPKKPAPAKETP
jgi:multidrug efflux pump subunit AcrA (membrane-fusion protein)